MGERGGCDNPAHVKLSVVIPARDEEGALPELFSRLRRVLGELTPDWEVVIVDDGSGDGTWDGIEAAAREEPRIRGLRLSRGFGHQVALTAGLSAASGDYVVTMDADLQHPPETIAPLLRKARDGFDVVYAVRSATDAEGPMKISSARWFYRALNRLTSLDLPPSGGDFRLMSRRVVDVLLLMPERHRFLRGMTRWVGFPQATVEFDRDARHGGQTKYSGRAMLRLGVDAIVGFSAVPLRLASMLGLFLSFLGALYFIYVIAVRLFTDSAVGGWASLLGVVLLLGGVQLACIGIIGQYLGRMYDEIKNRPLFVLREDTHLGARVPRDPDRPAAEPAVPLSAGGLD
jgi:glycosyltransferase involved in cell wall biosynthesis